MSNKYKCELKIKEEEKTLKGIPKNRRFFLIKKKLKKN